jgi:hypothetical protein
MDGDVNALVLTKPSGHNYIYLYWDDQAAEVARQLGRQAGNPALDLTWRDAAALLLNIREIERDPRRAFPSIDLKDVGL